MNLVYATLVLAATLVPLPELGKREYCCGYAGGLWDAGENVAPAQHLADGLRRAAMIQPRDEIGSPNAGGKIGFISIGYGNPALTFETFREMVATDGHVNKKQLVLVNAAAPRRDAEDWQWAFDPNYDRVENEVLTPAGITPNQVQVAWIQMMNERPFTTLPIQYADSYLVKAVTANALHALKTRYPNLQVAYLSGPEYAGYDMSGMLGEPYAYEASLSVRFLTVGQTEWVRWGEHWDPRLPDMRYDNESVPWLTWGPYLWANGTTPREDGLTWERHDFEADGFTLSAKGAQKSASQLLRFLMREPTAAGWFRISSPPARLRPVRH